jgi:hypothetical protein
MTWVHIEQEFALQSDLDSLNHVIESQKQVLKFLYAQRSITEKQLEHLMYRNRMERPTKAKIETKGEIA